MKVPRNRIVSLDGDIFGHFILSAISTVEQKGVELPNPEEYEVSLSINGVELPVEEVFTYWHKILEDSVEYRAEQIFNEKFRDVGGVLNDLARDIAIHMDVAKAEICNKLKIEYTPIEDT